MCVIVKWAWYMHLKYFLLNAWNSHQRNDSLCHTREDNLAILPRTHRPVRTETFAFSTSPNGAHTKVFLPRLVTPRLIPDAHTAAALSLLLLQSIHIHQVPSRSWRQEASNPSSRLSVTLMAISVAPLITLVISIRVGASLATLVNRELILRAGTARVCIHRAGYKVGP